MSIVDVSKCNPYYDPLRGLSIAEIRKDPKIVKRLFKEHDHKSLEILRDLEFDFDQAADAGESLVPTLRFYARRCKQCSDSISRSEAFSTTAPSTTNKKKRKMTKGSSDKVSSSKLAKASASIKPPPSHVSGPDYEDIPIPTGDPATWTDLEW